MERKINNKIEKVDEEHGQVNKISRRNFFGIIGISAIGMTAAGSLILSSEFLSPNLLKEPAVKFDVGEPGDFPFDSVTVDEEHKIYIVRTKEGDFYTLSSVCTHLGCVTNWRREENIFSCPCHGSKFNHEGNVIQNPAPRPLPRYAIYLDSNRHLIVDKTQVVDQNTLLKIKS